MTAPQTPRERLEAARARQAALATDTAPQALPVRAGDTIHSLRADISIHSGGGFTGASIPLKAGQNICITQAIIDASRNAAGWSWMSLIGDDDAQIAKWGHVRFRPGPAPTEAQTWTEHGDSDWREQREAARVAAWGESDPERRAAAFRALHERFGDAPVTSVIISSTPDPSIKRAEEQRARLDAGGLRLVSRYEAQEPGAKR